MTTQQLLSYRGPVSTVIFDWAGTMIDFGSLAPVEAFCRLFADNRIEVSKAEVREPMGVAKRDHIAALLAIPRVKALWIERYGCNPTDHDIDRLYKKYVDFQIEAISDCTKLIDGAAVTLAWLEERGIRVGANTGYSTEMITTMTAKAAEQGYRPESNICANEVGRGRPYPDMIWRNMLQLNVETVQAVVKVDDTAVGIAEGLNAGCWTVAVAVSGNETGLSLAEWQALANDKQALLRQQAYDRLAQSGAHYVIDTVADLPGVIEQIERRLQAGEKP